MQFWIDLWTWLFFVSLSFFAAVVVIVAIGGFFNIRSLVKGLRNQPAPQRNESPPQT